MNIMSGTVECRRFRRRVAPTGTRHGRYVGTKWVSKRLGNNCQVAGKSTFLIVSTSAGVNCCGDNRGHDVMSSRPHSFSRFHE